MTTEYHGPERRAIPIDCKLHEERLDNIDSAQAVNKGWLKGVACLFTVVGFVLSMLCTGILAKLGTITELLGDYRVKISEHEVKINNLQSDVGEIKDRHKSLDSNRQSVFERWRK